MEITSSVSNSSTFFGLGETTASQGLPLLRDGTPVTLWNRDRPSRFADENLYGSYPFLLELRKGQSALDHPHTDNVQQVQMHFIHERNELLCGREKV